MRIILSRGATLAGVGIALALAFFWLLRSPSSDLIPVAFRGTWLDQGAECNDTDAQVTITGSTIEGGGVSFKADGLKDKGDDAVTLTGEAFPGADTVRETVALRVSDRRSRLFIAEGDRPRAGPFVRCVASTEDLRGRVKIRSAGAPVPR